MNTRTKNATKPMLRASGLSLDSDQPTDVTHLRSVAVDPLAPTTLTPKSKAVPSGRSSRQPNEATNPKWLSAGEPSGDNQASNESQHTAVVAVSSATNQPSGDTQTKCVGGGVSWHELRAWAEQFAAVQQFRIAAENKVRSANVDAGMFDAQLVAYNDLEHVTDLAMGRCYRRVIPAEIQAWQKLHPGLGSHLVALLLGHLGNPAVAVPGHWEGTGANRVLVFDTPRQRTLSQLWQFCGVGDPARRKAKGMTADDLAALGNPHLKMLMHLLATKCMMARTVHGGKYGDIYEMRRLITADRAHATDCVRCGPSGKPALAGSPWSKAHQHADALRIVGKEILRDLWLISRTITRESTEVRQ